ncbi:redoxin family protein [Thalassotalea psychrophila]|uniref:Redoxin family protein n=1 Tax=Thalassotalea psychrophila TaxID=3065647 RepID=A0ABY9TWT0_9GAMM|nr:redoxin family protein [Colwelliaceae bacterium SQ149]
MFKLNIKRLSRISLTVLCLLISVGSHAQESSNSVSSKAQLQQLLDANKGKVIYLDFWASWCIPCRKSFPWMNAMEAKYAKQGFKVITVNVDVEKTLADDFLQENPANFSVIYDPKGAVAKEFKLKGMPSSYMINKLGKPVSAHVGFYNDKKDEYEAEIIKLLEN